MDACRIAVARDTIDHPWGKGDNEAHRCVNCFEIYARGSTVTVKLNGQLTAHMTNDKFKEGPFSLQFGNGPNNAPGGAIKWRKVLVRPI